MRMPMSLGVAGFLACVAVAQQPPPTSTPPAAKPAQNPLFAPPTTGDYKSPLFTAPGTNTLPDGSTFVPEPTAALGPGQVLRRHRLWASADFYHAAGMGMSVPPLVTVSPAGGTGALGAAGTSVAFGGRRELTGLRPGLRAEAGLWFDDAHTWGADASVFLLGELSDSFLGSGGPGGSFFSIPVYAGNVGQEAAAPFGTQVPTTIGAKASTAIVGGDVNLRRSLAADDYFRFDVLAGYRYVVLEDCVSLYSDQLLAPNVNMVVSDHFWSRNDFHGAQIGFASSVRLFDRLTLTTRATVAMGVTLSEVEIAGRTYTSTTSSNAGLLASGDNRGVWKSTDFAVVPEGTLKLGYDVTDRLRLTAGYSILFWSQVKRAGEQIDRTVLAPNRPTFPNDNTSYWVQGYTVGLSWQY